MKHEVSMYLKIYKSLAQFLAPLFLLTTIAFAVLTVYRGEIILGLQAELVKDKDKEFKVVVDITKDLNEVAKLYEQDRTKIEIHKQENTHVIEKIVSEPVFSTVCFSSDGLQHYNQIITDFTDASSESSPTMLSTSTIK